eukprot:scpid103393/ scgid29728/ 
MNFFKPPLKPNHCRRAMHQRTSTVQRVNVCNVKMKMFTILARGAESQTLNCANSNHVHVTSPGMLNWLWKNKEMWRQEIFQLVHSQHWGHDNGCNPVELYKLEELAAGQIR